LPRLTLRKADRSNDCSCAVRVRGKSPTCRACRFKSWGLRPQAIHSGRRPWKWNALLRQVPDLPRTERPSRRQ